MKKYIVFTVIVFSFFGNFSRTHGMFLAAGAVLSNKNAPLKKLHVGETYTIDGYSPEKYTAHIEGKKAAKLTTSNNKFEVTALKPCSKHDNVNVVVTKKDSSNEDQSKHLHSLLIAYPNIESTPHKFKEGDHLLIARDKKNHDTVQSIKPLGDDKGVVRISASNRHFSIKMQEDGETELHAHDDNGNVIATKKIVVHEKEN